MSSPRHEVIDVDSASVPPPGRGRRALTLDGADAQSHYDDSSRSEEDDEQLDEEDLDDDDDAQSAQDEEHAYRRGRQAIPMESPGTSCAATT